MKIAQIAPLVKSDPPRLSGGPERIVSYLTEGLVALGHDAVCQRRFDYECSIRGSTGALCSAAASARPPGRRFHSMMLDRCAGRGHRSPATSGNR